MKDRILFWCGKDFVYYGIAYFLNQQYDCELFSIIETEEKPKKFFKSQKLVPFKKTWFFNDYAITQNKEFDVKYLSSIEKKYGLNIWLIAYAERFFGVDERSYHKFTRNEILFLIEQECRFFEQVLDEVNPKFLIHRDVDFHHINLLHQICKAKGIKLLSIFPTRMGSKCIVSDTDKIHYEPMQLKTTTKNQKTFDELRNYMKKHDQTNFVKDWVSSSKINLFNKKTSSSIFNEVFRKDKAKREKFMSVGRTRSKIIRTNLSMRLKRMSRRSFLDRNSKTEIKSDEKFVYFPLHVSPERFVDISAPFFSNQLEVVTNFAKALPAEYKLYVKEHFAMETRNWRKISFYKQILRLPNVVLIHPFVPSLEILKKSSLIMSITGTGALQAAFYEKPSIVLSHNIYNEFLPSVFQINNLEELPDTIRIALKTRVNLTDLNRFVEIIEQECFDYDPHIFNNEYNPIFKTLFSDVNISEPQMKSYLNHHQKPLEMLASEHLKKIKQNDHKYATLSSSK